MGGEITIVYQREERCRARNSLNFNPHPPFRFKSLFCVWRQALRHKCFWYLSLYLQRISQKQGATSSPPSLHMQLDNMDLVDHCGT